MAHTRKGISRLEFEIGNAELIITNRVAYITAHGGEPKNQKTVDECKAMIEETLADLAELKAALVVVKGRRDKKLAAEAAAVWADHQARKTAQSA